MNVKSGGFTSLLGKEIIFTLGLSVLVPFISDLLKPVADITFYVLILSSALSAFLVLLCLIKKELRKRLPKYLMAPVTVMMLSYASLIIGSLLAIFFLILARGKGKNVELQGNSYGTQYNNNTLVNTAFYKTETIDNYNNLLIEQSDDIQTS